MFQYYADFEDQYRAFPDRGFTRSLNPGLQTFDRSLKEPPRASASADDLGI
jgi:hypothetical protein